MKVKEFINKAIDIATNFKTLYVLGCFGAPLNDKNKQRYINNQTYNGANVSTLVGYDNNGKPIYVNQPTPEGAERKAMIESASSDTFGFDCVCLIKGILWDWCGDISKTYGGASYGSNGVPDVGANTMMNRYCRNVSTDFSKIKAGEAVWIDGHIGIYIGNGVVVECTPKWENKVQFSNLGNVGKKTGNYRMWTKHGELPWVNYDEKYDSYTPTISDTGNVGTRTYAVKKGDTLTNIATTFNTTVDKIVADNKKSHKTITPNHIVVGWKLKV